MLSKRIIKIARGHALVTRARRDGASASATSIPISNGREPRHTHSRRANFHSTRLLLKVETVKVPHMAESLTEGTLKTWSKQVGDTVEMDEEVASIETDKIDVPVNAPKSGKIVEHLAKEEDTVVVGQDLFRLEPEE